MKSILFVLVGLEPRTLVDDSGRGEDDALTHPRWTIVTMSEDIEQQLEVCSTAVAIQILRVLCVSGTEQAFGAEDVTAVEQVSDAASRSLCGPGLNPKLVGGLVLMLCRGMLSFYF